MTTDYVEISRGPGCLFQLIWYLLVGWWAYTAWEPEAVPDVSPALMQRLQPWRVRFCRGAHAALELRAGQAAQYGISAGMQLDPGVIGGAGSHE